MKKDNEWLTVLTILAAGGFIWAANERSKRIEVEKQNTKIKTDYLKLLEDYLAKQKQLPDVIKDQIINLRESFAGLNDDLSMELKTVVELIEMGKDEIAIEKLTKVIENLLKEKYIKEGEAQDKRSCPALHKMLEKAKDLSWITLNQFRFSYLLREHRNEEAHSVGVVFKPNEKLISFLAGIEIIYNLKGNRR